MLVLIRYVALLSFLVVALISHTFEKDGLVKLAEGLGANKSTSLSKIDLKDNPIEDKGMISLAKAFETMSQVLFFY